MLKIKMYSDVDLDGYASYIVLKYISDKMEKIINQPISIDVQFVKVTSLDEKIREDRDSLFDYDYIYITDLYPKEKDTIEFLDMLWYKGNKIVLYDHHTREKDIYINPEWAMIETEKRGKKTCGASLIFEHIINYINVDTKEYCALKQFVELVRLYDTWDWAKENNVRPRDLNRLLYFYGHTKFIEVILKSLNDSPSEFKLSSIDEAIIESLEQNVKQNIDRKIKSMCIGKDPQGYTVGYCFSEDNVSELGNEICKQNPSIDYAIIFNPSTSNFSLRSNKIDVRHVARFYGGDGHMYASGIKHYLSPKQMLNDILSEIGLRIE